MAKLSKNKMVPQETSPEIRALSQDTRFLACAELLGIVDFLKGTGEHIKSCTMIICGPNKFVGEVHDRTPVLLMPQQF